MKLDKKEAFEILKKVLRKVQEDQHPKKIDVDNIAEGDNLQLLGMDSLDMIAFRFTLDQVLGIEIPDEDFEEKELTNIKNSITYLTTSEFSASGEKK